MFQGYKQFKKKTYTEFSEILNTLYALKDSIDWIKKQMLIKYQLKVNCHYNHTYTCVFDLNINSNMDVD